MNAISQITSASSTLATRAMIVSLRISQWSGRRLDREVTKEVNDQHGAASDAGRYNKLLLPKEALEDIERIVSETRNDFLKRTLPWMQDGSRIMAADAYLSHMAWLRSQSAKFDAAVDKFIAQYPGYVAAAAARLNGMFKAADYPEAGELRAKFAMECKVLPVPTSDDFRVAISDAQAERIRSDIEQLVGEATRAAVRNIFERIAELAERMVDRLNAYKPATKPGERSEGIFRDSLVENVRDLISVLPALDITGDPRLADLAERMKVLAEHDASVLREDEGKRRDVANEAQAILDQIGDFLA